MLAVTGKRSRAAAKTDEELVQAAPLRDQRLQRTDDAERKRRKVNVKAWEKTRMLSRIVEASMLASGRDLTKKKRELMDEEGVSRHFVTRSLVRPAQDESRSEQPLAYQVQNRFISGLSMWPSASRAAV